MSLISIYIGGVLSLLLALFHTQYYKKFDWKVEYEKISPLNQKIFYTIHLALLLLFFLFGCISIIYAKELSQSNGLAFGINLLYSIFWLWRSFWQIIYFKRKKGKKMKEKMKLLS